MSTAHNKGFSLIEMMIAVAIFSVVMVVTMGALFMVVANNRKLQSMQTVVNALNFAFEDMARSIRVGSMYHCGYSGVALDASIATVRDCASGTGETAMSFETDLGNTGTVSDQVIYRKNGSTIEKSSDGGATFLAVTPPEVIITDLVFYVTGSSRSDTKQPRVIVRVGGYMQIRANERSYFNLETMMTQRLYDIPTT